MTANDAIWDQVRHYGWFAERHHWTPEQVDRLPHWYAARLPMYTEILDQLEREEQARERERAEAAANARGR